MSTENETRTASFSGLSKNTYQLNDLGFDLMRNPRNDTSRVRLTAAQQQESWRRRNDTPGSVLGRAWSQVLMGDHPLGRTQVTPQWVAGFTPGRFRWPQQPIFCPGQLILVVPGGYTGRGMLASLERLFRGWGKSRAGLGPLPPVQFTHGPKLVLVEKDVNQSNIRMGHAGGIRVGNTPEYFAAQVADFLLGGGGGFNSRLLERARSDSGFAYSVFSVWNADTKREDQFFAGAQVRAEKTVAAVRLMRDLVGSMATEPVTARDVKLAQDNEVNSFVFQFQNAGEIVARQLGYAVDGLPPNWFDLYLKGIQAVTPDQVTAVAKRYLHADQMVILVVGKPAAFDKPLTEIGPVVRLPVDSIKR